MGKRKMKALFPEEVEAAKFHFESCKSNSNESASLFECVEALKRLGIKSDLDKLFQENQSWEVSFEQFCSMYEKKKEEKERRELLYIVNSSFNVISTTGDSSGPVDVQKLTSIFKLFGFEVEPEDFLARGQAEIGASVMYDDYLAIFDLSSNSK
uniref:EF-hand domain-containing protein n=1 Tax=Coptotermes formosanus TaxID=36987 RepID=R4V0T5_COPFO|nr:hypothetical protein [Coptotermes formosanus]